MRKLCAILLFSMGMLMGGRVARADSFTFIALPASGNISGTAGSTVGWGYSITNDSATQWLVPDGVINTASFSNGTPTFLFDYPIIAPGNTVTESFNALAGTGLLEFTWDSDAPVGFTNSGLFDMTGLFCADSSFDGCSSSTLDVYAPYSVTVVPEPTSLLLLSPVLALCWFMRKRLARADLGIGLW